MTRQDRDVLVCALISGTGLLLALTGLGWVAVQLHALIPKKNGALPCRTPSPPR